MCIFSKCWKVRHILSNGRHFQIIFELRWAKLQIQFKISKSTVYDGMLYIIICKVTCVQIDQLIQTQLILKIRRKTVDYSND